jgi:hypothetical protein
MACNGSTPAITDEYRFFALLTLPGDNFSYLRYSFLAVNCLIFGISDFDIKDQVA